MKLLLHFYQKEIMESSKNIENELRLYSSLTLNKRLT